MSKKVWFLGLVLVLSFFITTAWQDHSKDKQTFSSEENLEVPLIIGYSNWAGWLPWAVAESEGLFDKRSANVEFRWYDNYSKSLEDLAAGVIDGNCQTLGDTISFAEIAVNGEVVVLVNDNSAGNDKIIASESIKDVPDLKGQSVAVEAGVVDDFLLTLALEREGLSRSEVNIVDIETGAAAAAFAAGSVDAVGAFPPFWLTALERQGAHEIASSSDFPGAIADLLVVSEELVAAQPDQVQSLVDTWFDALSFIENNSDKADKIMANRAGTTVEEFELFKQGTKMFDLSDNLEAFSPGNDMVHLSYAARNIGLFLQENFQSLIDISNIHTIFNRQFIDRIS